MSGSVRHAPAHPVARVGAGLLADKVGIGTVEHGAVLIEVGTRPLVRHVGVGKRVSAAVGGDEHDLRGLAGSRVGARLESKALANIADGPRRSPVRRGVEAIVLRREVERRRGAAVRHVEIGTGKVGKIWSEFMLLPGWAALIHLC